MATTIETNEERATKLGVSYFFAGSNIALADGDSIDICTDAINGRDFFLRSVIVDSDASLAEWQMYQGHEPQEGTGQVITLNSRNPGAKPKEPPLKAVQDPTLTQQGTPLFPVPRTLLGQTAPGNNSFMYIELLTGGYIIPKGGSALFRITNKSGSAKTFSVLMSGRENI